MAATTRRLPRAEPTTTVNAVSDPAAYRYPVNEVMLRTLVRSGKSGSEIAALCSTSPATVAHMREAYDV